MNTPNTLSRIDEINEIRDGFRAWVRSRAAPPVKISEDLTSPSVATLAIVSGPDVLLAGAVLGRAVEELAYSEVDVKLVSMMRNAVDEAFKIIEQGTAVLDPKDELYQPAIEKLAERK